jgi:hypothetical protein
MDVPETPISNDDVYFCNDCQAMFSQRHEFEQHSQETDHTNAELLHMISMAQIDNKIIMLFELS